MGITLSVDDEVHSLFFVSGVPGFDWLGLSVRPRGGRWEGHYRFRYHANDEIGTDDDTVSWWKVRGKGSAEELDGLLGMVAAMTAENRGGRIEHLLIRGTAADLMAALEREPWAHDVGLPSSRKVR